MRSANAFILDQSKIISFGKELTLSQTKTLDLSKLKKFANDNFKFEKKWQKVFQKGRKHFFGKMRNCSVQAISRFPTLFSKDLPLYHTIPTFNDPQGSRLLKTMFSVCSEINFNFYVTFILSSAKAFSLDQSRMLSFAKELTHSHIMTPFDPPGKQAF